MNNNQTSPKNFWLVLINALILGWLGAHRFAVGKWKSAMLQLFTLGGFGVWVFIDVLTILLGKFTDANGLPVVNTSKAPSWIVTALFAISLLVRLAHHSGGSSSSSANNSNASLEASASATSSTAAPDQLALPADEKTFVSAVAGFIPQYNAAPNELKKSAVRAARKAKLQELAPTLEFNGWVGRLEEMVTTSKGNASLKISLPGGPVSIVTQNNELSDIEDKTLIPIGSDLFNRIADLKTGTMVKISGRFISEEQDYIQEMSITEEGSVTEPEFVAQFNQVEKAQ
jgi:TM2 domain-containing membrane protein YozV